MRNFFLFSFVIVLLTLTSCGEYNKVLKSNDIEYKYTKALEYYNEDKCYQALPIFEELIGMVRGTMRAEDVYYYYAQSHYCTGDYYLANYYFKNFVKTFAKSSHTEECLFLAAMCSYKLSPNYSLDQMDTRTAINEFQLFIDRYPYSELKDSCNTMVGQLRYKLEKKSYEVAKLYVKTEKYKSAIISLNISLKDFPDTEYREDIHFLLVKSSFLYAQGSIASKKTDRFNDTIDRYYTFVAHFPESALLGEAERYFVQSQKYLEEQNSENL
jgi:outer membrane protein assembly factor BamD